MEATKKQTKRETTIEYFTKKSESVDNYKDYILIFQYKSEKGLPCAAILRNREKKPSYHYQFRSESERVDFINRQKTSADNDIEREAIMKQKAIEEAEKMNVGTILYSDWGYEQTNIDFYVIVERSGVGVTLQQIGGIRKYSSDMSGTVTPDIDKKIGEPFKKRINKYGNISLTSYSGAYLYDGTPKMFSTYA